MSFSKKLPVLLAAGILSFTQGCAWLRDSPKATQSFQSKAFDLTCLNAAPAKLQNLFAGNYTDSARDKGEIQSIWKCLDHGLNTFSAYTRGQDPNFYTASELQQFANRYLPANEPLGNEFVHAIFKMKMAVVGGNDSTLNRLEIDRVRKKVNRFGEIIEPLAPYLKILLSPTASVPEATRRAASTELNRFVLNLADVLGDSANVLPWSDLLSFVRELELYTTIGQKSALTYLREELPLIQSFKLLIVGGSDTVIENEKWNPIFQSISRLYDAVYLTSSNTELLQHLDFDIRSTDDEQKRAVTSLIATFKNLKGNPNLQTHVQVEEMSNRFAQLLLINSAIFPRTQGSLALKPFFSTESMRLLTGYILEEIPALSHQTADQAQSLQKLVDDVGTLLDQAAVSSSVPGIPSPYLSLSSLQSYVEVIRPLFLDPSQPDTIIAGFKMLKNAIPVLMGSNEDQLKPKDLKNLIQKAADAYLVWNRFTTQSLPEKIGASLDILIRDPRSSSLSLKQIVDTLDEAQELVHRLGTSSTLNWTTIKTYIAKGFRTKAVLFNSSADSVTSDELIHLGYLWQPFRNNSDLSAALDATANLLANRPFADVKIVDLLDTANSYMASPDSLSRMGLDAKVFGDLKVLFAGGSREKVSGQDYARLAHCLSAFYAQVGPQLRNLPSSYQPGLNSVTVDLAASVIKGLIDAKKDEIVLSDLKTLLQDVFKNRGYTVRDETLTATLSGFYTRVFNQSKGAKPSSLSGLVLKPEKLKVLLPFLSAVREQLADLEQAYAGLDVTTQPLARSSLLSHTHSPVNAKIIKNIQPLLDGTVHMHHFPKKNAPRDLFFEFDLAYKTSLYGVMNWLMPFYKIAPDTDPAQLRLSLSDLTDLLTDLNDLVYDLKLSLGNSAPAVAAKARMQTMDVFTQVSNGDGSMDILEAVEFLTITFGGKILLSRVEDTVFHACFPGVTQYSTITQIPYSCLSRVAFTQAYMKDIYGPVVPQLVEPFLTYSPAEVDNYRKASFTATQAGWSENGFMAIDDFETFVSLPYFLENIFERFDVDTDDTLRFSELMTAFPSFCLQIDAATGGKLKGSCVPGEDPRQIEAIYGYLIFNGRPPTGTEPGNNIFRRIHAYGEVLVWFNRWNHLNRDSAIRDQVTPILKRQDMLSIISNLSASTADAAASPGDNLALPQ